MKDKLVMKMMLRTVTRINVIATIAGLVMGFVVVSRDVGCFGQTVVRASPGFLMREPMVGRQCIEDSRAQTCSSQRCCVRFVDAGDTNCRNLRGRMSKLAFL